MSITKSPEKNWIVGHYKIGPTIGQGTFGKVRVGVEMLTGEKVAVKILKKEKISEAEDLERVAREISILKVLRHPHIVQLYEIIETSKELYLIMEYASEGELFDYIISRQRVKEAEACLLFQQIIAGVEYMNKLSVAHRDLKPENLLLDQGNVLKIVDFGLSNSFKTGEGLRTACGSPCYAAPEMLQGMEYSGLAVDIWSCGVVLYAMLCGFLPFDDPNTANLYKKIIKGEFQRPRFLSETALELISGILNVDPSGRFGLEQIKNHQWFKSVSQDIGTGLFLNEKTDFIDEQVIESVGKLELDTNKLRNSVERNKHNHDSTVYYLLAKKKVRELRPSDKLIKPGVKKAVYKKVEVLKKEKLNSVEQRPVVSRPSTARSPVKISFSRNSKPGTPSKSPMKPQSPRKSVSPIKSLNSGKSVSPGKRSPIIGTCQGPFNVECLSCKDLSTLTQSLSSALTYLKVRYVVNGYKYICQGLCNLAIEICVLEGSSMYVFKFARVSNNLNLIEKIIHLLNL